MIEKTEQPTVVVNNYTIQNEEKAAPVVVKTLPRVVVVEKAAAPSPADIDYYGKKLKITSWILIVLGVVTVGACIHSGLNARHISERMFHGKHPHPHNGTEGRHPHHEKFMDRDEFALYDIIKTCAFVGTLFAAAAICVGKKALWAVNIGTKKPAFVTKQFKKTLFKVAFMALCAIFIHHHS